MLGSKVERLVIWVPYTPMSNTVYVGNVPFDLTGPGETCCVTYMMTLYPVAFRVLKSYSMISCDTLAPAVLASLPSGCKAQVSNVVPRSQKCRTTVIVSRAVCNHVPRSQPLRCPQSALNVNPRAMLNPFVSPRVAALDVIFAVLPGLRIHPLCVPRCRRQLPLERSIDIRLRT